MSGSETDVSTSNENLSNEEKYVIRHTARQEPQGQENLQSSNRSSLRDSLPSNRSSLDVSSSSYNTLIIHSAGDEPWIGKHSLNSVVDKFDILFLFEKDAILVQEKILMWVHLIFLHTNLRIFTQIPNCLQYRNDLPPHLLLQ